MAHTEIEDLEIKHEHRDGATLRKQWLDGGLPESWRTVELGEGCLTLTKNGRRVLIAGGSETAPLGGLEVGYYENHKEYSQVYGDYKGNLWDAYRFALDVLENGLEAQWAQ